MNLNPYEKLGKNLFFIGLVIMAIGFVAGVRPPMWSVILNVAVLSYLIYFKKL